MYIKDLHHLGWDLTTTIIIDNLVESFFNHQENGILVKSWYDDKEDNELLVLMPFLQSIVEEERNVQEELKKVLED